MVALFLILALDLAYIVGIVAPNELSALHLCPTLVAALDLYISTAFVRVKVGM